MTARTPAIHTRHPLPRLFGGVTLPGHPDPTNIQRLDVLPLPMIRRMQQMGLGVNREGLWDLSQQLDSKMVDLRKQISSYVPEDQLERFAQASVLDAEGGDTGAALNVDSGDQIASLLFDILGIGFGRKLKRTKTGERWSTGKKQLETLKRDHPVIPLILSYREASKLKSTYTDKLPTMAVRHNAGWCLVCGRRHHAEHWRIHGKIVTTRTDTGRLAHRDPNLANIPARSKLGQTVRACFVAQPGHQLLSADYSQIELRLMAHCSQEPNMLRIFREGGDIHLDTAMRAFGITDPKLVDKTLHRAPCKNVNFGVCLLENQQVLTNKGLVSIQNVTSDMLLWDGEEWVQHDGVIYKGFKKVIEWDAVTATPEHKVWVQDGRVLPIAEAMAQGLRLAVTAHKDTAVRYDPGYFQPNRKWRGGAALRCLWPRLANTDQQFTGRPSATLHMPQRDKVSRRSGSRQAVNGSLPHHSPALHQPNIGILPGLRWTWNQKHVRECLPVHSLGACQSTPPNLQGGGYWQDQQRWTLRAWESAVGDAWGESAKYTPQCVDPLQRGEANSYGSMGSAEAGLSKVRSLHWPGNYIGAEGLELGGHTPGTSQEETKAGEQWGHVYDILNAGPRHRFTCEGKLVSNCYGLGGAGLLDLMAITYATAGIAVPDWLDLKWCEEFIDKWFRLYPEAHEYLAMQHYRARRYGMVWTLAGRVRRVPETRSSLDRVHEAGLRQAGNMPIQGTAADLNKIGMAITEHGLELLREARVDVEALMSIHDELLVEVEDEWAETAKPVVEESMALCMNPDLGDGVGGGWGEGLCRVPILTDGKLMRQWVKE